MQTTNPTKKVVESKTSTKILKRSTLSPKKFERLKLIEALLTKKHEDGKPVCAYVLEMKSHIDSLRMIGVEFSGKLVVDWAFQSLPELYGEFIREYHAMNYDVTLIDFTYVLNVGESSKIWRTGQAYLISQSNSQTSMYSGKTGSPERTKSVTVRYVVQEDSICFYYHAKGHW